MVRIWCMRSSGLKEQIFNNRTKPSMFYIACYGRSALIQAIMNTKEKQLAAKMLEMASDEFSNHGCNDIEDSVYEGWTLEERQQFVKEFHEWNGDPENFDKDWLHLGDSTIMSFLAYKLETDAS